MNDSSLYFDYCTATPCPTKAKEAIFEIMLSFWASPWAPYHLGQKGVYRLEESLSSIRDLLKIDGELLLTHSGAEATGAVLKTYADKESPRKQVIALQSERLPVLHMLDELRKERGISVDLLPIGPKGYVELEAIKKKVSEQTALVLLPCVDSFSGVLQPLEEISQFLRHRSIPLSVDVTYALAKMPLSFRDIPAEHVTFDARLLGSPIGLGAAVSQKEISSFLKGDIGSSEIVLRAALLHALLEDREKEILQYLTEVARLRDLFETLLKEALPQVSFAYQDQERLSAFSTVFFSKVKNEALLFLLQKKHLFASLGGADRQVLVAQFFERGFTPEKAQGAVAFSFSSSTQEKAIREAVRKIQEAYEFLQTASEQGIFSHD